MVFPDEPTPGIRATVGHLMRAFAYNINLHVSDEGRPDVTESIRVHEIGVRRNGYAPDVDLGVAADCGTTCPAMDPVVVHRDDDHGVTVTAVLVQHAPVFPAFGSASTPPADRS